MMSIRIRGLKGLGKAMDGKVGEKNPGVFWAREHTFDNLLKKSRG